jgi:NAD-dependent DNA ligase
MIIDCEVCGSRHVLNSAYDNKDTICQNNDNCPNPTTFQQLEPLDLLSRNAFNWNELSTRVNEKRDVHLFGITGPDFRGSGERITSRKKYNW